MGCRDEDEDGAGLRGSGRAVWRTAERELLGLRVGRLHAGRANRLLLPVELSHGGVLSGLWKAATGGRVEGVLTGIAKLRVPAGDLEFPFEFPVKLSRK